MGDRLPYVMMHDGLLMPLFAGVILCLAGRNRIAWFFGLLPFIAIGEASYCLYLLHFNLWTMLHDSHFLEKSGLIVFDPVDFVSVIDRRRPADQKAHRTAGKKLDYAPPSTGRCSRLMSSVMEDQVTRDGELALALSVVV